MADWPATHASPRSLVVLAEEIAPAPAAWLAERCEVVAYSSSDGVRFPPLLARAAGLVVRTYTRVDSTLLEDGPNLKVVGRAGVGLDNIDVSECRRRGVEVVHTPDANTGAVVEFVFARLFERLRPHLILDRAMPPEQWNQVRRGFVAPRELSELTLGIWGLGRIGSRVARAAAGFGVRTIYHDLADIAEGRRFGAIPVTRETLLREADVLSIHVDARPSNRALLSGDALMLMKPDAIILNTSRGFVVDSAALAAWLRANQRHKPAAFIDVHDPEPLDEGNPLLGCATAMLSPHVAAATKAAHEKMSWVVRDVWRVLRGEPPEFPAPNSTP